MLLYTQQLSALVFDTNKFEAFSPQMVMTFGFGRVIIVGYAV